MGSEKVSRETQGEGVAGIGSPEVRAILSAPPLFCPKKFSLRCSSPRYLEILASDKYASSSPL